MSPGATFERVYHALKEDLGSGRYAAGQPLEPAALSYALNASITPVRDALHRLVGEGLAETRRTDGFRTPLVTERGLRQTYRWNAALLDLATRGQAPQDPRLPVLDDSESLPDATARLFRALARWSGNVEHVAAVDRLNARLRPVRCREPRWLAQAEDELAGIAALMQARERPALRRALGKFHRRRERVVADLVASLLEGR